MEEGRGKRSGSLLSLAGARGGRRAWRTVMLLIAGHAARTNPRCGNDVRFAFQLSRQKVRLVRFSLEMSRPSLSPI
jgi:hypothetical protein